MEYYRTYGYDDYPFEHGNNGYNKEDPERTSYNVRTSLPPKNKYGNNDCKKCCISAAVSCCSGSLKKYKPITKKLINKKKINR